MTATNPEQSPDEAWEENVDEALADLMGRGLTAVRFDDELKRVVSDLNGMQFVGDDGETKKLTLGTARSRIKEIRASAREERGEMLSRPGAIDGEILDAGERQPYEPPDELVLFVFVKNDAMSIGVIEPDEPVRILSEDKARLYLSKWEIDGQPVYEALKNPRTNRLDIHDTYLGINPKRPWEMPDERVREVRGKAQVNLWTGFEIHPKDGPVDKFLDMLFRVYGEHYEYIEKFMAHVLQFPNKRVGVALNLVGKQGAGKSTISEVLCRIIGEIHTIMMDQADDLTSDFSIVKPETVFVQADEVTLGGNTKSADKLKSNITGRRTRVNEKWKAQFFADNCSDWVVSSNHDHSTHLETSDRRNPVFGANSDLVGDLPYWNEFWGWAEKENGLAHIAHHLLNVDLSGWDPRDIPMTEARRQNMEYSLYSDGAVSAWAHTILEAGEVRSEEGVNVPRRRWRVLLGTSLGAAALTPHHRWNN